MPKVLSDVQGSSETVTGGKTPIHVLPISSNGASSVAPAPSIYGGSMSATSVAAQLQSASQPVLSVDVQAAKANTDDILVGSASGQWIRLSPEAGWSVPVDDFNKVYVRAVSGTQTVNYAGSGA